jgi:hypothetical protein
VVAITAAPFGAPAPPTVEPTAQHRVAEAQARAVSELTGAGSATGENVPSHGDPAAMGEPEGEPAGEAVVEQAPAITARATTRIASPRLLARLLLVMGVPIEPELELRAASACPGMLLVRVLMMEANLVEAGVMEVSGP